MLSTKSIALASSPFSPEEFELVKMAAALLQDTGQDLARLNEAPKSF